jgi:hypothetical protein
MDPRITKKRDSLPERSALVELWMAHKDRRRRTRKHLPALIGADVVFLSHAKSGRTWVRALISNVWHRLYGVPENDLVDLDNFKTIDPRIPSLYFTHWVSEPWAVRRRISRLVRSKPVVFLARDPRDVATSHYFHFVRRSGPRTRRRRGLPANLGQMSVPEFLMNPRFGVGAIAAYNRHWERRVAAVPRGLALHYEALRAAPLEHLRRLMVFLGTPASDEVLEAAIAFADFESLRKKEQEGFFLSDELRAPKTADEGAFKVRRGKIGGYRDYLTPEQIEQVDEVVAGFASRRLLRISG